jgi:uncharacterized protein YyaL (SSP411 family)
MTAPISTQGKIPNRLIHEKSPYLLQHAYNPVDWYPWGEEAFGKAREENKPIFLSIGYSTCYWCHVMEREVFENPDIAKLMNEHLVCIKVDREERPDLDRIYMTAVQALTGSGGWPMSVFLTPDLKPFFGGTYFPPVDNYGRPGFPTLVKRISELWQTEREKLIGSSEEITSHLSSINKTASVSALPGPAALDNAFQRLHSGFDPVYGGFGGAPKFPRPVTLNFLSRYYARTGNKDALNDVLHTLRRMAEGGVYDHIGGGFHRYSVDEQWRVPHFEKMLYDQAQLANSYLDAYQVTHEDFYGDVAWDILQYILMRMTDPLGGFYSAEDAESAFTAENPGEKEEGVFYLWTKNEIEQLLLPDHVPIFCYRYGINDGGNALRDPQGVFGGKNILYIAHSFEETAQHFNLPESEIREIIGDTRKWLFDHREHRPRPHLDDKILTAWNGLMISAFARAYQIFENPDYLNAAVNAAKFISTHLYDINTGMLHRRYRGGEARFDGSLQDYAFFIAGLLDLYEASFDVQWIDLAIRLMKKQHELFADEKDGGYFDAQADNTQLLFKTKEDYDGAEPTGNSVSALNLLRLAQLTGNSDWRKFAERSIMAFGSRIERTPEVLPQMLVALDWCLSPPREIVIAGNLHGDDTKKMLREISSRFIPYKIVLVLDNEISREFFAVYLPFLNGMNMIDGKATAYVCENYACKLPVTEVEALAKLLDGKDE